MWMLQQQNVKRDAIEKKITTTTTSAAVMPFAQSDTNNTITHTNDTMTPTNTLTNTSISE
jgi:hypothetical protein